MNSQRPRTYRLVPDHARHPPSPRAHVLLAVAEPVLYVEKGGRGIVTLADGDDVRVRPAFEGLAAFIISGRGRKLSLERVDGEPVVGSSFEELLVELGFRRGPRMLTLSA